jgi:hypothetical protein
MALTHSIGSAVTALPTPPAAKPDWVRQQLAAKAAAATARRTLAAQLLRQGYLTPRQHAETLKIIERWHAAGR